MPVLVQDQVSCSSSLWMILQTHLNDSQLSFLVPSSCGVCFLKADLHCPHIPPCYISGSLFSSSSFEALCHASIETSMGLLLVSCAGTAPSAERKSFSVTIRLRFVWVGSLWFWPNSVNMVAHYEAGSLSTPAEKYRCGGLTVPQRPSISSESP